MLPRGSELTTSSSHEESSNKRTDEVVKQQIIPVLGDAAQAQRKLVLQEIKQGNLMISKVVV